MKENEDQQDFISIAFDFLNAHRDHQIMILTDNGVGVVETFHSNMNIVWAFGILSMAEKIFTSKMQENRNFEMEKEMQKQREIQLQSTGPNKGKAN